MSNAAPKSAALLVLRRLRKAGFQALFAGGCVRDRLLHLRSSDYDIATDATPEQVRKLFPHVLLVGAQFGVAMVVFDKRKVEVAAFRTDLSYQDGRRPTGVKFSSPREDALRRDFTINGMFLDPLSGEIIDYVGGRQDLAAKVLRTIGRPEDRFGEDYLRMIRAVRFAVRFDFAIDPATAEAIRQFAPRVASISGERVYEELSKMLARPSAAEALRELAELGLAQVILPELFERDEGENRGQAPFSNDEKGASPHFRPPDFRRCWDRVVQRVEALARSGDVTLAIAAMLAELPAHEIDAITRRWGGSNDLRESVTWIAQHLNDWRTAGGATQRPVTPAAGSMPLHQFKRLLASPQFPRLRRLWSVIERIETLSQAHARAIARRIASIDPAQIAPAPLVTGDDLKSLGLGEGPHLGKLLRALYDAQLDERLTGRAAALDEAKRKIAEEPRSSKHQ